MRRALTSGVIVGVGVAAFALTGLGIAAGLIGPAAEVVLAEDACDVGRGPCVVGLADGGQVDLAIDPRPIAPARPLTVRASFVGRAPTAVELRVVGVSMAMGTTRLAFTPAGLADATAFTAEGSLPVCITGTMIWLASLYLDGASEPSAHVRFETGAGEPAADQPPQARTR